MSNKLFFAPIKEPERILDIGTGTGIWAIEMGDAFPNASVIGTDLSPTQPTWYACSSLQAVYSGSSPFESSHTNRSIIYRVPENVKFEIDDAEQPWTFRTPFDLIHARYLAAAITDWPQLMRQTLNFTKPGGYAEFQDFMLEYYSEDGSMKPDMAISQWIHTLLQASKDFGKDPNPGVRLESLMKEAVREALFRALTLGKIEPISRVQSHDL